MSYYFLQKRNHLIHHQEVADTAQHDKYVENLMAPEPGVIPSGPLDGVEHSADGVEDTPGQKELEAPDGHDL